MLKRFGVGLAPALVVAAVLVASYLAPSTVNARLSTVACSYTSPTPTVTGVAPSAGPRTGGTSVTITGTQFCNGLASVHFGATAASFSFVSNTSITAVSPAHAAGIVDVTVTTAGGTSAISSADKFTFTTPVWCATFNLSNVPTHWVQRHAQVFFVIVTNCGSATWPFVGHTRVELDLHFTKVRGGSAMIRFWLSSIANHLHYNVGPGTKTKITFTLAPLFHGNVYLEALMVKEHSFWFDQVTPSPAQFASVRVGVLP